MPDRVENTSAHARTWDRLKNAETGRTLHLAPGEQADTELPVDFHDRYLHPVTRKRGRKTEDTVPESTDQGATDTEPAAADDPKE